MASEKSRRGPSATEQAVPAVHAGTVTWNRALGGDAYLLRVHQPELAAGFRPGQFVGVKVGAEGGWDPLLRRPFSIMRSDGGANRMRGEHIDLLHVVVGRGTRALAGLEVGATVDLLGPLGNSWFDDSLLGEGAGLLGSRDRIVIAAGGVGVAPFFAVVEWLREAGRSADVTIAFGARSRDLLCGREELDSLGCRVELATDDGSEGYHGRVTGLLAEVLAESPERRTVVLCCGPDPMMRASAAVARDAGATCLVSLENFMPCGMGACFACVVYQPARPGVPERYARACLEGPIFPAELLGW